MITEVSSAEIEHLQAHTVLKNDEIHLWFVHLDEIDIAGINDFQSILSAQEKNRAARFHFPSDRHRFVVTRLLLRLLIAAYTQLSPEQIRYQINAQGKPALPGYPLHFNISGSKDLAAFAFAAQQPLGVDVEYLRPVPDAQNIAQRFFAVNEWKTLHAIPAEQQLKAFMHCWTRKEAYIKSVGEGLSIPLQSFEVTLELGKPARLVHIGGDPAEASRWSLVHLEPADDYVGALAVRGSGWQISSRLANPQQWLGKTVQQAIETIIDFASQQPPPFVS